MTDIGIVMPVYNQEPHYLQQALQSILTQTDRDFSLVVVIDGATDNSHSIIAQETKDDPRVHIHVKPTNEGVATALNDGFKILERQPSIHYWTWVSSDNVYYPHFLSTLRQHLQSAPADVGLVYSAFRYVDGNGAPLFDKNFYDQLQQQQQYPKHKLLDLCFIGTAFLYKRAYAQVIGGYRLQPVEDYDYWLRLTEVCNIQFIPQTLMDYRYQSTMSISTQLQSSAGHRRWRNALQTAKKSAYRRRGLKPKITVLAPIADTTAKTIQSLESLLDQNYSHYRLLLLDRGPRAVGPTLLKKIPDPRITLVSCRGLSRQQAIRFGLHRVKTPLVLIWSRSQRFLHPTQLNRLYNYMHSNRKKAGGRWITPQSFRFFSHRQLPPLSTGGVLFQTRLRRRRRRPN